MPRDISGNYTLPAGNPVVDATIIDVTWGNGTMNDIAAQLNNVVTRDGVVGPTAPLKGANGSAAAPAYSFTAEPNLGFYRNGAGQLSASVAGTEVWRTLAAQLALVLGSVGTPAYSFIGDPNTGMYSPGADQIGFSAGGALRFGVNVGDVTSTVPYIAPLGAVGAPSYTFTGDLNTGMYSPGADQIAWSTAGVQRLAISATGAFTMPDPGAAVTNLTINVNTGSQIGQVWTDGTASVFMRLIGALGGAIGTSTNNRFDLYTNNAQRFTISATGNATVVAPSSGIALTVTGAGGNAAANFVGTAGTLINTNLLLQHDGTNAFIRTQNAGSLFLGANSASMIQIGSAGNISISAPTSGNTLSVDQFNGSATAIITSASVPGNQANWQLANTSAAANSDARMVVQVNGAAAGDPFMIFNNSGVTAWTIGLDNSDSDAFKIANSGVLGTGDRLTVTTDGRWYGSALHNNAGSMTGTTNQYVGSGTYTPGLTNTSNIAASSVSTVFTWIRLGNVIQVSGWVTIDPTAGATNTVLDLSVPIASAMTGGGAGTGVRATLTTTCIAGYVSYTGANSARYQFFCDADAANREHYLVFHYVVN